MLRQLYLGAPDTLHPVMVRGVEGMAIFHHGPHADFATRPATPQPVRRHRMLRPPLHVPHYRCLGAARDCALTCWDRGVLALT